MVNEYFTNPRLMGIRRSALKLGFTLPFVSLLLGGDTNHASPELPENNEETLLNQAKEREYVPDSELRTTIFPRKIFWEMVQVLKAQGKWDRDTDESDWLSNLDIFENALISLESAGFTGGRLVIAPYEVEKGEDGQFDWVAMDTAIELMDKHKMKVDLSIGPFNTAYYPGVRLPKAIEDNLEEAFKGTKLSEINIDRVDDPNLPDVSKRIREFGLEYVKELVNRYKDDSRVDKFYLGNEWPDRQTIENVTKTDKTGKNNLPTYMTVSEDYMVDLAQILLTGSQKNIVMNTNIHPSDIGAMKKNLGKMMEILGSRAVLGLDTYPDREVQDWNLRWYMNKYQELVGDVRNTFPLATVVFTELQGSPWPEPDLIGKSWYDICKIDPQLVKDYFMKFFPTTIDSHLLASKISEVGLWNAEVLVVLDMLQLTFAGNLMAAIAQGMKRRSSNPQK